VEDSSYFIEFLFLVILLVLSAFFSSAETSLTSLTHLKRKKIISENKKNAKFIEKLYHKPGKMLTTILVGNNIVNILASIVATFLFVQVLSSYGVSNKAVITTVTTVVMTVILLIFGEISPKTLAIKNSEEIGLFLSRPVYYFSILFSPVISVLNNISKVIIRITGGLRLEKDSLVSEEEIKLLITMGLQEGVLEEEEEKMLTSVIEFGDIIVREVMIPRTDIVAADSKSTIRKIIGIINRHGHSRIPIYSERIDNVTGIIYAKDLLQLPENKLDDIPYVMELAREPFFVPESKKIDELLKEMRKDKKQHMAIVVDEYGGVSGIITIEDIIEEIIGEISDEYDGKEAKYIEKKGDNVYLILGMLNVGDLNKELNIAVPEEDDYDSIAGYVVNKLGKIPVMGDIYEDERYKFTIINVVKQRVVKLKLEIKMNGEKND